MNTVRNPGPFGATCEECGKSIPLEADCVELGRRRNGARIVGYFCSRTCALSWREHPTSEHAGNWVTPTIPPVLRVGSGRKRQSVMARGKRPMRGTHMGADPDARPGEPPPLEQVLVGQQGPRAAEAAE